MFCSSQSPLVFSLSNFKPRAVTISSSMEAKIPHVLTVAGSDSGAGAGIQADLKACAARGVYCSTVITAVTAQNTVGVQGVNAVPVDFVKKQLESVLSDMRPDVVKTGMLPSTEIIRILCQSLRELPVQALVVDPVMVSTSGDVLAGPSILDSLRYVASHDCPISIFFVLHNFADDREELLPMADIVTPNIKEASRLLGCAPLETIADMRSAAKSIHQFGPRNVLVKGGDLQHCSDAVDILYDGNEFFEFRSSRVKTQNSHGTGCTLAAAIAAELAKGLQVPSAVKVAKRYVETALEYSKDILIGNGNQKPLDHLLKLKGNFCRPRVFDPQDLFLYAVTDSRMNKRWGRSMTDAVKAAIEGGATIVQIREKDVETQDFLETAKACLKICRSYDVPLLINDRIDVALACDADGVHIGQSDMPASIARSLLGPAKIIGVSCKTPEQAEQAFMGGADYIGSGGVFPTNTKENNLTIGLDGLRTVCLASKLPVVAIGGINASNSHSVMKLGLPNLKGVAVVSALFDRESVSIETRKLYELLAEATRVVA